MYLCKYDLSKECKGSHRDCVECIIEDVKCDIYKSCCFYDGTQFARGLQTAIRIIDKHLGKEKKE